MKQDLVKLISGTAIAATLLAGSAGLALAQNVNSSGSTTIMSTTTTTGTSSTDSTATSGPSVPGIPNTGAGGDATGTWLLLGVVAFIAIVGGLYLVGRRTPVQSE
jgi:hypothetical protein